MPHRGVDGDSTLRSRGARMLAAASLVLAACGGKAQSAPPPKTTYGAINAPRVAGAVGYRLPVLGTWRVQRTHYNNTRDQAYAIDILMPTANGRNYNGGGKRNSDWGAYNQPIVAPAAGVVAIVVDGVPDNDPGVVNSYDQHGNYVVIDHQNGEFSLMAHLIPGSVRVRPGQPVAAGTELGRCGNSGNTTNPHLHWQVMDNVNASLARGVPPRYLPYLRNGAITTELPDRGDTLGTP